MKKGKISNVNLAADISKIVEESKGNPSTPTPKALPVFEHMQHHYDKDDKIVRQSCMKAAASAIVSKTTDKPETIAAKIIAVSDILFQWVKESK